MERRAKVELFEHLRREYEFGLGTIKGVADKFGLHRRMVRQAIEDAMPPERKHPQRRCPKLEPVKDFIDSILENDKKAPRKQRHTAHRIYERIIEELSTQVSEPSVRRYVRERKKHLGLAKGEIFIPQTYEWGQEAQVDWYEAFVDLDEQRQKLQFFSMRSMASGAAFHRAYLRATQQAFFEAHLLAFDYFGGVFRTLRYDNLTSAVKKILRGHTREMIELLLMGRKLGEPRLKEAIEKALSIGCTDSAAVRYLMQADHLSHKQVEPLVVAALEQYDRPQPCLRGYDQLLAVGRGEEVGL